MDAARKLKAASGGAGAGGSVRAIVPARLIVHKKRKNKRAVLMGEGQDCACPPVSLEDGFLVNWDGNLTLMVPPATGGPWIPAIGPNGPVFINGGGL